MGMQNEACVSMKQLLLSRRHTGIFNGLQADVCITAPPTMCRKVISAG